MRKLILAGGIAAATFLAAVPATAVTFTDNFDAENGGASMLNYTGFANFTTIGQVDLVKSGDYNITCSGSCVDLDGTSGPGGLLSGVFHYNAGDVVTLSFDLGGSQRIANGLDNFTVVLFSTTDGNVFDAFDVASTDPFKNYSYFFTASGTGSVQFSLGTDSQDNIGPLLDNVSLNIAPVPEPATWAMMMLGFGVIGLSMRRGKVNTVVQFA